MRLQIYLTHPLDPTILDAHYLAAWDERCGKLADLNTYRAEPGEVHGELLTRIYQDTLDSPNDLHLISEFDFIPARTLVPQLCAYLQTSPFVLVHYGVRGPDGLFTFQNTEGPRPLPLIGAWFIAWNRGLFRGRTPRLNWLRESGSFNDAANLALVNLIRDDLVDARFADEVIKGIDSYPAALGIRYPGLGVHEFFHRHLNDDVNKVLVGTHNVGSHIRQIRDHLKE